MTFRAGVLAGRRIAVTGAGPAGSDLRSALSRHGATVIDIDAAIHAADDAAADAVRVLAPLHGLVIETTDGFGAGGAGHLQTALDHAWRAARAVATGALIDAGNGGRIVFVAPPADAGGLAEAAQAALENLARTLSVEWARFGITAVTLAPKTQAEDAEVATLVTFLLSAAGGYFTGCRFDLGRAPTRVL